MLRSRHTKGWVLAALMGTLLCIGCEEPQGPAVARARYRSGDFAGRRMAGANLDEVRSVAARCFGERFRLDADLSTGDLLISRPAEATDHPGSGRLRNVLGSTNRMRRVGILKLGREGGSVLVQCQVRVERLDTVERAAFARNRGDDRPGDTPIDRLGADAPNAREEWVAAGRDRQAEAAILDAIVEHFAATPAGG